MTELVIPEVAPQPTPLAMPATSPNGIQYQLVLLTPQVAKHWLDNHNGHNRALREGAAEAYAADIIAGKWVETGDTIKVAPDGTVVDGQHRLAAIVKANTPLTMMLVSNVPIAAQDNIDNGIRRTFPDILKLRKERHYNLLAAAIKRVWCWENGYRGKSSRWARVTVTQLLDALDEFPTVRDSVDVAAGVKRGAEIRGSVVALCHWLFNQIEPEDCEFFFARLRDGANLHVEHPIYVLRRTLADHKTAKSIVNEHVNTAWVIKAWNAYRAGRDIKLLRFSHGGANPEKFPEPE